MQDKKYFTQHATITKIIYILCSHQRQTNV